MTTEERVDRLEGQIAQTRRLTRVLLVVLVLCAATLVIAGADGLILASQVGGESSGRYAISGGSTDVPGIWIVDTRTSQVWLRCYGGRTWCAGTNEKPEWREVPKMNPQE